MSTKYTVVMMSIPDKFHPGHVFVVPAMVFEGHGLKYKVADMEGGGQPWDFGFFEVEAADHEGAVEIVQDKIHAGGAVEIPVGPIKPNPNLN